jgi:hypothetical protein
VFGGEIIHTGSLSVFLQVTDITVWLKKPEIDMALPVMKGLLPSIEKELPKQPLSVDRLNCCIFLLQSGTDGEPHTR